MLSINSDQVLICEKLKRTIPGTKNPGSNKLRDEQFLPSEFPCIFGCFRKSNMSAPIVSARDAFKKLSIHQNLTVLLKIAKKR